MPSPSLYDCKVYSNCPQAPKSGSSASGGASTGAAAAASGPVLSIPVGASTQGNPAYDPNPMTVKKGDTVQVQNKDQTPHTVTSGKGLDDPAKGKLFDTSIIAPADIRLKFALLA